MLVRMMRLLLLALAMWGANAAQAATLSCPSASTLESLVQCISLQMPQDSSNGYHAPSATQRSDFQAVYEQMLRGNCSVALPASLSANMLLRQFNDTGNGRSYCVLMEVTDADNDGYVDMGWGTFITYAGATREGRPRGRGVRQKSTRRSTPKVRGGWYWEV